MSVKGGACGFLRRLCPQPGFVLGDRSLAADVVAEPTGLLVGGRGLPLGHIPARSLSPASPTPHACSLAPLGFCSVQGRLGHGLEVGHSGLLPTLPVALILGSVQG